MKFLKKINRKCIQSVWMIKNVNLFSYKFTSLEIYAWLPRIVHLLYIFPKELAHNQIVIKFDTFTKWGHHQVIDVTEEPSISSKLWIRPLYGLLPRLDYDCRLWYHLAKIFTLKLTLLTTATVPASGSDKQISGFFLFPVLKFISEDQEYKMTNEIRSCRVNFIVNKQNT